MFLDSCSKRSNSFSIGLRSTFAESRLWTLGLSVLRVSLICVRRLEVKTLHCAFCKSQNFNNDKKKNNKTALHQIRLLFPQECYANNQCHQEDYLCNYHTLCSRNQEWRPICVGTGRIFRLWLPADTRTGQFPHCNRNLLNTGTYIHKLKLQNASVTKRCNSSKIPVLTDTTVAGVIPITGRASIASPSRDSLFASALTIGVFALTALGGVGTIAGHATATRTETVMVVFASVTFFADHVVPAYALAGVAVAVVRSQSITYASWKK